MKIPFFSTKKKVTAKRTIWEEILRMIFLYKNEVHFDKKDPHVEDLAKIIHFFFSKLLKMKGSFTLEEIPAQLMESGYKRGTARKVEEFVNTLSHIQYTHSGSTKSEIFDLIHTFETVVYQLNIENKELDIKEPKKLFQPQKHQVVIPPFPGLEKEIGVRYGGVHVVAPEDFSIDISQLPEPPPTKRVVRFPRAQKISLPVIEFNNILQAGQRAIEEDRIKDARSAYEMLGQAFQQLSAQEKKELHARLLEYYGQIIKN
ncbi:MAG: hypothetical protein ABIH34_07730 [Nanoarchaeota archaeon]